ncbi:hypothetical protein WG908_09790 [Sphingobium sp. AN641]|uniref:hypothetical protein n=1 Tax=Sphingobium sp. AN641 TaxID=3133443 RepID=UPI0030C03CE5
MQSKFFSKSMRRLLRGSLARWSQYISYDSFAVEGASGEFAEALISCLAPIAADITPGDIPELRLAVSSVPMPIAMLAKPETRWPYPIAPAEPKPKPNDVAVAFLEFSINGQSAESLHSLSTGQVHDLDLMVRVSHWPESADRLVIAPVSVEPASMWDFPTFEVPRPSGPPPYTFERGGRMALHGGQGFNARPLEFRYAAEFQPAVEREQRVVVAGQRTLRLNGADTTRRAVTGYGEIDAKIVLLREKLRLEPLVSERDIMDLLTLLAPLGNLLGQAVQDKRYPMPIDEAAFEKDVLAYLRANTGVGQELELQAQVAGGRTDLSFRGIRIELKSERSRRLVPDDCKQYAQQAATYAVGSGRRVSVLLVLDSSKKKEMPFPVADGIFIIPVETGASPIYVITLLVQGGFPRPSDLSR